ncbi:MAG TPA: hypothetical protein VFW27_25425 [Actinoplanes sp.]|nr:hypothetical protein [Actinoplanes sp.]
MNDDTTVLGPVAASGADDFRDDGLAAELARAAPRKWWNKATVVLGAAVLLVGGFAGGLQAQKQWGAGSTGGGAGNRAAPAFPGTGAGRFGGRTAAPAASASSAATAATTGTVKLVDGNTIYVQTPGGDIVTVRTDARTRISTARAGKVSDVTAGQSVAVQGAAGSDGTVTATSVTAQAG